MATEDPNKKNIPEEKLGETKDDKVTDDVNAQATDEKATPAEEEETEPFSAIGDTGITGLTTEPDTNAIKELTPQELEERSIDEEETEFLSTGDCRCQELDGEYYCFKLRQGRWIQWSVIPFPTKKICEAACCNA